MASAGGDGVAGVGDGSRGAAHGRTPGGGRTAAAPLPHPGPGPPRPAHGTFTHTRLATCHPQNLGDEGCAYVVEALAFNTSAKALDLSQNGISGVLGTPSLCQVLPTCVLQTLVLSTNSLGDSGAEAVAQVLSGAWRGRLRRGVAGGRGRGCRRCCRCACLPVRAHVCARMCTSLCARARKWVDK